MSDQFLQATGRTRSGYLGGLRQETMQFQLNQTLEAKLHSKSDTTPDAGDKIRLLTINASPIDYDFVVAARTHRFGVTSNSFSYNLQSDLLPGFDFSSNYSLFQGDPLSDTAQFKPFRTGLTATFTIGKKSNPFATLRRIFGGAEPKDTTPVGANLTGNGMNGTDQSGIGINSLPATAGSVGSRYPYAIDANSGVESPGELHVVALAADLTGTNVKELDVKTLCAPYLVDPIAYQRCLQSPPPQDTHPAARRRRDAIRDARHKARCAGISPSTSRRAGRCSGPPATTSSFTSSRITSSACSATCMTGARSSPSRRRRTETSLSTSTSR